VPPLPATCPPRTPKCRLKEAFYDLWDSPDRTTAADRFRAWKSGIIDRDVLKAYQPLLRAWRNWEQERRFWLTSSIVKPTW
jgi:hypothetical protein